MTLFYQDPGRGSTLSPFPENLNYKDEAFLLDVKKSKTFNGQMVETEEELFDLFKKTIRNAVISMFHAGTKKFKKGKQCFGEALEWSNLDFYSRKIKIIESIKSALADTQNVTAINEQYVSCKIDNRKVLIKIHAIPAPLGVPSAIEMVGKPFQKSLITRML